MTKKLFICAAASLLLGMAGFAGASQRAVQKLNGSPGTGTMRVATRQASEKAFSAGQFPDNLIGAINDCYMLSGDYRGLYKISGASFSPFSPIKTDNFDIVFNGIEKEGVYYIHSAISFGSSWFSYYVKGIDIQTGAYVYTGMGSNATTGIDMALDPVSGKIYGIFNNTSGDGYRLGTITYGEAVEGQQAEVTVETVAPMSGDWNSLACDANGQLYAIANGENATLYKVDKQTAATVKVGPTGVNTANKGSATIDPKTGRMFWTTAVGSTTALYEVDPATGEAAALKSYLSGNAQIIGLVVPSPPADDAAPAQATDLKAVFPGGNHSGNLEFKVPSTTFDGTQASGELDYKVSVDGKDYTGKTTYGASVSVPITVEEDGEYMFVVVLSNAAGNSPKASIKSFIGKSAPKAPENVKATYADGKVTVTWDPVTESAKGGYMDPAEVTYTVKKGNVEVAIDQKGTSYEEQAEIGDGLHVFKYSVSAKFSDLVSDFTSANDLVFGNIVPPYKQTFDTETSMVEFTLEHSGIMGRDWQFSYNENQKQNQPSLRYSLSSALDSWMITAPVRLEAGKAYRVNLNAFATASASVEKIEIKYGKEPKASAMTETAVAPSEVRGADATPLEGYVTADTDGLYYIGIHGISEPNQAYLYIDDLEIAEGISASAPVAVANLKVIPGANGAKEAAISFDAPSKDLAGNAIAKISKIEIACGNKVVETFTDVTAGESKSFRHELAQAGDYTYTVTPYTGEVPGQKTSATVYVGNPLPADISTASFKETATPGEVTVTWTPVTTDADGQPLDVSKISYTICPVADDDTAQPLFENLTGNSKTFVAVPENGTQQFMQFIVYAVTERGRSKGAVTNALPVGKPMISFDESFPNGSPSTALATGYENNGEWQLLPDMQDIKSADGDNGFAAMYSATGGNAGLVTGKIDLSGFMNPALTFKVYNWSDATTKDLNEVSIDVCEAGTDTWASVATVKPGEIGGAVEGWYDASASLTAFAGKTVQIKIQASALNFQFVPVDAFRLVSLVDNDLCARAITGPARVKAGSAFAVRVEIANEGGKEVKGHSVGLYADGKLLETKNCEPLASGAKATVQFDVTMHPLADSAVEYHAEVNHPDDSNAANNKTAVLKVEPVISTLPAVTDLTGSNTDRGRMLTWSEPYLGGANSVTENFDSYPAATVQVDGWTFIDRDDTPAAVLSDGKGNIAIAGVVPGETKTSFLTFDTRTITYIDNSLQATSGNFALAAIAPKSGAADDWAISPELSGEKQTITFNALSLTDSNPEKIRVLYSTGSSDPADFKEAAVFEKVSENWQLCKAELPEGAKRFAINSCAPDGALLLIDDIKYSTHFEATTLTLAGFNVYRNGEKINTEPVEDFEYLDTDEMPAGGVRYVVTALYDGEGESKASNEVEITVSSVEDLASDGIMIGTEAGAVVVAGAEGERILLFDASGKLVLSADGSAYMRIPVEKGVYIARVGNTVRKLYVR